jgi:hypothetical protein
MIELKGNIFNFIKDGNSVCIPTNGIVKSDNNAVMGAGLALAFANKYNDLPKRLGGFLSKYKENKPYILGAIKNNLFFIPKPEDFNNSCLIFSFPTKNNFKDNSDLFLIEKSCIGLVNYCNKFNLNNIYMAKPGVGLGNLNYVDVKKILNKYLDNRFIVLDF